MEIRKARPHEFAAVRGFYHSVIDAMEGAEYGPGWKKGIYPADEELRRALESGTLFLGEEDSKACAAMVVNHEGNESYADAPWPTAAEPGEFAVIHMLCVHPACGGRGLGGQLVDHALDLARKTGQKCVRLDVLKGNLPANRLYEGRGFRYIGTLPMFYEDTGWTDYELYEYSLEG